MSSRFIAVSFVVWLFSAALPAAAFYDGFDLVGTIEEAGSMTASASSDWWVNSGGRLVRSSGLGMTVQGTLPVSDPWRVAYSSSNPVDTENGYRPQNIFRFVTRQKFQDFTQEMYFRIRRTNLTDSPNRNASNGVLFFHHYQDGNNLYYVGVRVDGTVVVKKKRLGTYYTLAQLRRWSGTYDRSVNPNLLPLNSWIGMRTVITDTPSGGVILRLELDDPTFGGGWTPILEVEDTGLGASGPAIPASGYAGIRTDFMDLEFEGYSATTDADPTPTPTKQPTVQPTPTPAIQPTVQPTLTIQPTVQPTIQPTPTPTLQPTPQPTPQPTTQPATSPVCSYSFTPGGQVFEVAGGVGTVYVTAPAGCGWAAVSNNSWITVTGGSSGSGSGTVTYSVARGWKKPRVGTMTIGGQTFTVSQDGTRRLVR